MKNRLEDSGICHYSNLEALSEAFDKADLVICLDFNKADRLHAMQEPFDNCKAPKILIDHHLQPDIQAKVTASHTEMCSTCELVFRIVWQLGGFDTLDRKFASTIYCGMMTDTGGFTYNSTRPEIFFIICQLLTKKIHRLPEPVGFGSYPLSFSMFLLSHRMS